MTIPKPPAPRLIPGWQRAWRMFSVQAMTLLLAWLAMPAEAQEALLALVGVPKDAITGAIAALGLLGRLIQQQPTAPAGDAQ